MKKKQRFCKSGHDTFLPNGRNKSGKCKKCQQIQNANHTQKVREGYLPKRIKQICKHGHNTFIVGRTKWGRCRECDKICQRKYEPGKRPKKRFCKHGHDTFKCGRDKKRMCKKCKQIANLNSEKKYPEVLLAHKLRTRLYQTIRGNYKTGSAVRDLGCTIEFFKDYIASKFYDGMRWNNYGKVWELDHIKELWEFDLTDRKQFLEAVHYTNYRPLTIPDHLKKTIKNLRIRHKLKRRNKNGQKKDRFRSKKSSIRSTK